MADDLTIFGPTICESLSSIAQTLASINIVMQAAEAGYNDVQKYIVDRDKKNPQYPARKYLECVKGHGAGSTVCNVHKDRWLDLKSMQIGRKITWNEEGNTAYWNGEKVHKMLKEDGVELIKKDPRYLEAAAREYNKCIAEHGVGAENTLCKHYKKVWMEAQAIQYGII